jgi:membrane-associated phospholipid phosphatase
MKRMVQQPTNLTVLALGATTTMAAHPFDAQGARAHWSPGVREALEPGQLVGSFAVQTTAGFATYLIGRTTHNAKVATVGADLFRANMLAQTTTQLIKFSTQRTRPDGTAMSFPSGHASASFATATVLQSHFGWKAGIPAYAMATWVAASRVQGDRHFISDVVAGATVGILAGRTVTVGHGRTKFAVAPMAAPGGLGVSFTRIEKK